MELDCDCSLSYNPRTESEPVKTPSKKSKKNKPGTQKEPVKTPSKTSKKNKPGTEKEPVNTPSKTSKKNKPGTEKEPVNIPSKTSKKNKPGTEKEPVKTLSTTSKKKTRIKKQKDYPTDEYSYNFIYLEDNNLDAFKHICPFNINEYKSGVTSLFDINHKSIPNRLYAINEDLYQDIDMMSSDEDFQDYRLYKVMRTEHANNVHDDDLSLRDLTEPLTLTQEVTKLGLIINLNVYLSYEQWHTIRKLDKGVYACSVCELQCGGMTVADHLRRGAHVKALSAYPPLKRFDLSITRKINQDFHCGVCNVLYPITNHREHENSKEHEGNLLFAINKVSDIMWISGKKNTIEFDNNNIQEPNNAPSNARITGYSSNETQSSNSYSSNDIHSNSNNTDPSNDIHSNCQNLVSYPSNDIHSNSQNSASYPSNDIHINNKNTASLSSNDIHSNSQNTASYPSNDIHSNSKDIASFSSNDSNNQNTAGYPSNYIHSNSQNKNKAGYPSNYTNNVENDPNAGLSDFTLDNAMQSYISMVEANLWSDKTTNPMDRALPDNNSSNNDCMNIYQSEEKDEIPRLEYGFNFGKSYKDIKIYEEEEMEEYTPPIEGVSYACMASKPRLQVPKFLKIDLGTKEVRVKFESWNMITQTDLNQFYCMACTQSFQIRFKIQHCLTEVHKKILAKCSVVGAFEDYLIRDVNDKLYHCGHCNNLQYKNDMQIHVEKYHLIKNAKPIDTNRTTAHETRIEPASSAKIDINSSFKFLPFGTEIVISNLSCHTLMLVNNRYNCALCDVYVQGELIEHVYEALHMRLINMTPFIKPFLNNLIRAVRGSLHCAICNILINVSGIKDHNISPTHTNGLADALGMVRTERPRLEIKYQCEERAEFKSDPESFLATLPQNSRDALSLMKIKNHKGELFNLNDVACSSSSGSSDGTPNSTSLTNSPSHAQNVKISAEREKLLREAEKLREIDNATNRGIRVRTESVNSNASNKVVRDRRDSINSCGPQVDIRPRSEIMDSLNYYLRDTDKVKELDNIKKEIESCVKETVDYRYICNPKENYYPKRDIYSENINRDSVNQRDINNHNPKITKTNHNNNEYATNFNNIPLLPGQMLTLSMIDSNLQSAPVSPMTLKVTGPIDVTPMGNSCIPVTPVKVPDTPITSVKKSDTQVTSVKKSDTPVSSVKKSDTPVTSVKKSDADGERCQKNAPQKTKIDKRKARVDSDDEEELKPFKFDETVLLKLKSSYFKITSTAYNTLLHRSNGSRYCFVCSSGVDNDLLQKHVESMEHIKNIAKNKFLYNFSGQLFRQMYLMYHCAVCNVTMTRTEVKVHVAWTPHIEKYDYASKKLSKKYLKEALKCGTKEYTVETQREILYVNILEPCIGLVTYVQSASDDCEDTFVEAKLVRKSQMVIQKGNMMKISFESWHGILKTKNGVKCIICQVELREDAITTHVETQYHNVALGITFEEQYYPALVRKINKSSVNCVICNLELPNDDSLVFEHIQGRKHDKKYNALLENTSHADSYSDCYPCPITL